MSKYLVLFLALISLNLNAQNSSKKLRKEQDILEQKLKNTQLLLTKTKGDKAASLNELQIINNQVRFREELVRNFDRQVRGADLSMREKREQIRELNKKVERLKKQYKKLVIYAYKHRSKFNKLMFIFSSDSYYEALKRNKYLGKLAEIQKKQYLIIKQHQGLINREIDNVKIEKDNKLVVLGEKQKEREAILVDKRKQELVYIQFKKEEASLLAEMKQDQRRKEAISRQIDAAIKREIAAAEKKRKEEEAKALALAEQKAREEEARRKAEAKNTKTTKTPTPKPTVTLPSTNEATLVGKSFEANRGRLPWPVLKGTVTENYGKNPHPTFENVFTNNNGIDISAFKNSAVRAVFEGEVTSVLNIPGAGKVVILKHGNYRTVYSNLQTTSVSIGDKVTTKENIGTLLVKEGNSLSVLHFEVHQVYGGNVQSLNPVIWITR
ncbi:MAG: peptidoglycan DD-metalloendopeptidase family protein [Crocinitomicaceae bacterium]|nr:peptidoglycan DD-metalloendopeptidase family protein [Crocinitomicaceae bacterium]